MQKILFIYLLFIGISINAQNDKYISQDRYLNQGQEVYLFGDNVHLRSEASADSKSIKILPIGSKLIVQQEYEPYTTQTSGIFWVHVKNNNDVGYIRSDFISIQTYTLNNQALYTQLIEENDNRYLLIRLHKNSDSPYIERRYEVYPTLLKLEIDDNKGLSNVDNIIHIKYLAEACGVNGGGKYIFIKSGKWIDAFEYTQFGDAGIFYWIEELIFPNEHKKGDFIKYISESMSTEENEADYENPLHTEKHISERILKWNGKEITPKFKQLPSAGIEW